MGLSPKVACHTSDLEDDFPYVADHRRKQSPEKVEVTKKGVEELHKTKFTPEAKYTTWMSNLVLV